MRSWTSASGATLTAALVEEKGSFVVLKKEGGGLVEIAQTSLSASDRMYIAELKKASSAPVGAPAAEHPR
jgi:hypothetical protein